MKDTTFPCYFSIGPNYLPFRGYVRCDSKAVSVIVGPDGIFESPYTWWKCLAQVVQGKMKELSRHEIETVNRQLGVPSYVT